MQSGPSETCRIVLLICGWLSYAATAVVIVMIVMQSSLITTAGQAAALVMGGVVSGALLHTAAHVLGWLAALVEILSRVESDLRHLRDRADQPARG